MWGKIAKLALKAMKNGGIKNSVKGEVKKYFYAIVGVFAFLLLIIAAIDALKNSFLCNDVIKFKCPKPPIDIEKIEDLGEELYDKRKKVWAKLEDQETNRKFRTVDEIQTKQDGGENNKVYSEAEYLIRILATIDFNTYVDYIKTGDLKKGKPLHKSIISKNIKYAREDMSSIWKSKKSEDKNFSKDKTHYFMNWRIKVYECYLLGEGCNDEILESMGTEDFQGVATQKNGDNFKYKSSNEILNKFYEISLIKHLDGKISKVPKGESEAIFLEMLNTQTQKYNEIYPSMVPNSSPSSISAGWLNPMITGTYNFSSPFGMRWGKPHQGVDMGTMTVVAVPYFAAKSGVVVSTGYNNGGYGGVITIDHGDGFYTTYSHMETKNMVVRKGQNVAQGQLIGGAGGEPGLAIHLHFEICTSLSEASGNDMTDGSSLKICGERVNPEGEEYYGGTLRQHSQDMKLTKEYANKFLNEWKAKASTEVIIMPGFSAVDIGALAVEHEGTHPGKCIAAVENSQHLACGAFQTTHTSINEFLNFLATKNPDLHSIFKGTKTYPYNKEFVNAWKKAYDKNPNAFYQAQYEYTYLTHYKPIADKLKEKYGYDVYSKPVAVQAMIFSSGTQHRHNTYKIIWAESIGDNWKGKSDYEIIDMFWNRRSKYPCCTNRWKIEEYQTKELLATGKFTSKSELWQPIINGRGKIQAY